jgi:RNA polymerase sigma-70 factor (ECF subfamily)
MDSTVSNQLQPAPGHAHFITTQWGAVLSAGRDDSPESAQALTELCQAYWYPVYVYIRRKGKQPDDAQDLTQEFFARLIEKKWLADIAPSGGRFRSFLLTAVNRFLANEYDRSTALKRGGGRQLISLDQRQAEERYVLEPATQETPERIFERRWALALLDRALTRLQEELSQAGKSNLWTRLNTFLSREPDDGEYSSCAATLSISQGAVGVAVHRLRHRYRQLVRAEVASTLTDAAGVDEEMQDLFAVLRG